MAASKTHFNKIVQPDTTRLDELNELILEDSSLIIVCLGSDTGLFEVFINASLDNPDIQLKLLRVLVEGLCCLKTNAFLRDVFDVIELTKFMDSIVEQLEIDLEPTWFERLCYFFRILITACKLNLNWKNVLLKMKTKLKDLIVARDEFEWDLSKKRVTVTCKETHEWFKLASMVEAYYTEYLSSLEVKTSYADTPIVPTQSDLRSRPNLRAIITTAAYSDQVEYLEQLFFLMREDFLTNLRKGIQQFQQQEITKKRYRHLDVRIYRNVYIDSIHGNKNGISYQLHIAQRRRNIKSPKPGQLVILSKNNFETCLFATVLNSPYENELNVQTPFIKVEGISHKMVQRLLRKPLVMAEPSSYFKAYRHVLEVLQQYHDIRIPFRDVLLNKQTFHNTNSSRNGHTSSIHTTANSVPQSREAETTSTSCENDTVSAKSGTCLGEQTTVCNCVSSGRPREIPKYSIYIENSPNTRQAFAEERNTCNAIKEINQIKCTYENIQEHGQDNYSQSEVGCDVDRSIVQVEGQPYVSNEGDTGQMQSESVVFEGLDESQIIAVQSALRDSLCVIQGPPGCGKTFIGLKIVKEFLHQLSKRESQSISKIDNCKMPQKPRQSPILIVCYTNHALDQFLEGILKDNRDVNLIRVGSRSKSETLLQYTLSEIRYKRRRNGYVNMKLLCSAQQKTKHQIDLLERNINTCYIKLKLFQEGIIGIEQLLVYASHFGVHIKYAMEVCENISNREMTLLWLDLSIKKSHSMYCDRVYKHVPKFQNQCVFKRSSYNDSDIDTFMRRHIVLSVSGIDSSDHRKAVEEVLHDQSSMENEQIDRHVNAFNISLNERRKLYRHWVMQHYKQVCRPIQNEMYELFKRHEDACGRMRELEMLADKEILCEANIIGMTTTCASANWSLLHELQPKTVIVEEAAQVFESHILASLTRHCTRLIMIGDHKQLKPPSEAYNLQKSYDIDVSLFERLVNRGIKCNMLNVQRRMRPEIADNIRLIYPTLIDSECVQTYPDVKGIRHNLFWISHNKMEDDNGDDGTHSNAFEAKYILSLTQYLLKQGYHKSDITVLTFYKGQMTDMREMFKSNDLNEVAINVIDEFQGKENDIILLSLVRANAEGNIGFVSNPNRLNVSLSRAKIGLYIIGNAHYILKGDTSGVWRRIHTNMSKQKQVGEHLTLVCQNHPKEKIAATTSGDFEKSPSGGCSKQCPHILEKCGHQCPRQCHFGIWDHDDVQCKKPCERLCANEHRFCDRKCYDKCKDKCSQEICFTPANCSHIAFIECWRESMYMCKKECVRELTCGHRCVKECNVKCEPCIARVDYVRTCGHPGQRLCCENENLDKCKYEMSKTCTDCGQTESIPCFKKKSVCQQVVIYTSKKCGHNQRKRCSDRENCNEICERRLDCGHTCTAICGQPFYNTSMTMTERQTSTCSKGHVVVCNVPCSQVLKCGHKCAGSCNKCIKGRFHLKCNIKDLCVLACGHLCNGICGKRSPCAQQCTRKCAHTLCNHTCSSECSSCSEPCPWKCPHHACSKKCGEICDRPQCPYPCQKRLRCGHPCMGMCGDVCPNICKTCDREIMRKTIGCDSNYQLVQLMDCGDLVRVDIMDKYMSVKEDVLWKVCPICDTAIMNNTYRYTRIINQTWDKLNRIRTAGMSYWKRSDSLCGVGARATEHILNAIETIPITPKEQLKDRMRRLPLKSTQNLVDFQREFQRMLDCEFIVQTLNGINDSTFNKKTSELLAAIDLVEMPNKYCLIKRNHFMSFIDSALIGVCNSSELTTIRFECEEHSLQVSMGDTDEMCKIGETSVQINEGCRRSYVVTIPVQNGRPYTNCGTSSAIQIVLREFGTTRKRIGISSKKYPKISKISACSNQSKASNRDNLGKRKSEREVLLPRESAKKTRINEDSYYHFRSETKVYNVLVEQANTYHRSPINERWSSGSKDQPVITMKYLAQLVNNRQNGLMPLTFEGLTQHNPRHLRSNNYNTNDCRSIHDNPKQPRSDYGNSDRSYKHRSSHAQSRHSTSSNSLGKRKAQQSECLSPVTSHSKRRKASSSTTSTTDEYVGGSKIS